MPPFDPDAWLESNRTSVAPETPFDPDAWLESNRTSVAPETPFDPDAWLESNRTSVAPETPFDPDAWLKENVSADTPPAAPALPGGPRAPFLSAIDKAPGQPLQTALNRARTAAQSAPAGSPERAEAMQGYYGAQADIGGFRADAAGARQNEQYLSQTRPAYLAAKGLSAGITFGLGPAALGAVERSFGANITPETAYEQWISGVSNMAGLVGAGQQIAPRLQSMLPALRNPRLQQALIRSITAGLTGVPTSIDSVLSGARSPKQAFGDLAQNIVSSTISVMPEQMIPPGIRNAVSQVAVDLVTDITLDALRGEFKDRSKAEWFATRELPSLALSVMFALADLTPQGRRDLRASQEAYRKFKQPLSDAQLKAFSEKYVKPQMAAQDAPGRAEPPAQEKVAVPADEPAVAPVGPQAKASAPAPAAANTAPKVAAKTDATRQGTATADRPLASELTPDQRAATEAAWEAKTKEMATPTADTVLAAAKQASPRNTRGALNNQAKQLGVDRTGTNQQVAQRIAEAQAGSAPTKGQDIHAEGRKTKQAGFVSLPQAIGPRKFNPVLDWFRRQFSPTKGTDKELYKAHNQMQREKQAARIAGSFEGKVIDGLLARTKQSPFADQSRTDLIAVQRGDMPMADFAAKHGMAPDDPALRDYEDIVLEGARRRMETANRAGLTAAERERILENEFYQTRILERWVLGDEFVPDAQDYREAVGEVADQFASSIVKIGRIASKLSTKKAPFGRGPDTVVANVARYLETGDARLLRAATGSRRTRIEALRRQYLKLNDMIEATSQLPTGDVVVRADQDALVRAAQNVVDYHLGKQSTGAAVGGLDVNNLKARTLDAVWRKLYGEITDPTFVQAKTAEVQNNLMAQAAFFQKMYAEGEGKWWWQREAPGLKRLGTADPQDMLSRRRYGDMAGKWVSEATHKLIHPAESNAAVRVLDSILGTVRLTRLFGVKTIARNYITAYTGFAVGSGDAFLPGYHKYMAEAHKLLVGYARGDKDALAKLLPLTRVGVMNWSASSLLQDAQITLSAKPGALRPSNVLSKMGNAYAMIDFATKYASYKANMDAGMTSEQAAAHVERFYQSRDKVPAIFRTVGRTGIMDYGGYIYDSTRIAINQGRHAIEQAGKGNLAPAVGFLVSHGIQAALVSTSVRQTAGRLWSYVHRAIRREDAEAEQLSQTEQGALREFLPEYNEDSTLMSWREKGGKRNKEEELVYTVGSNNSAWSMEDLILSAMQAAVDTGDPRRMLATGGSYLGERIGPGLIWDAAFRAIQGEPLGSKYNREGILDLGTDDPNTTRVWAESIVRLGADMLTGQLGQVGLQLYDWGQGEEKRKEQSESGAYVSSRTKEDIIAGAMALLRTYRVTKGDMDNRIRARVNDYTPSLSKAKNNGDELHRLKLLRRMEGIVSNAKTLVPKWYSDSEYRAILSGAGLSREEAIAVVSGNYDRLPPYQKKRTPSKLERIRSGNYVEPVMPNPRRTQ